MALIKGGVEPSEIIAFTFTERAAESLKTRITKRVSEIEGEAYLDRLGPMYIGTIYGYCLRMLQDNVPEFGDFDILDENRLAGLLSREHRRLELSKLGNQHWRPINDFLRNANVVENELLDANKRKGTPFGDCYLEFKKSLHHYHFLTFGLLVSAAVKALARPEVFAAVEGRLKHLIVDEYQDVNPAQEKLIARPAQPPVSLCVWSPTTTNPFARRGSPSRGWCPTSVLWTPSRAASSRFPGCRCRMTRGRRMKLADPKYFRLWYHIVGGLARSEKGPAAVESNPISQRV